MQRRQFLKSGAGLAALGVATWWWLAPASGLQSLSALNKKLTRINNTTLKPEGSWSLATTFSHLAQSIEYSMIGYPENKPPLFQSTLGKAAFAVFKQHGAMHHDVEEAIPGAPALNNDVDIVLAKARLQQAIYRFIAHEETFQPHFVFGELEKQDYAIAHVLHIQDHIPALV
nr:DUF1569 domain-containing protein [Aestuariibacter salexigens]